MGSCSLQHMKDRRSTCRGRYQARYVPPSGFGYPLDGFLPSNPCRFFSHRQRSWDSPFGGFSSRKVSDTFPQSEGPTCRFFQRCSRRRSAEPARWTAAPGSCPFPESLAIDRGVSPSTAGASRGIHSSRVLPRKPRLGFRPASSHALCGTGVVTPIPRRPRVSIGFRLVSSARRAEALRDAKGDPLRVFAPAHSRSFERKRLRVYEFTSRRVVHCCRPPAFFEGSFRST
jgi:hypothetical protein